jgi:hypothetical protein
VVRATSGLLALLCWERADALTGPEFGVSGAAEIIAAFQEAPIHR